MMAEGTNEFLREIDELLGEEGDAEDVKSDVTHENITEP